MLTRIKNWARQATGGRAGRLAGEVRDANLTYLNHRALVDLYWAVRRVERTKIAGRLIEAGTALGGSAVILASAKDPTRPLDLYDTFGMIPPPGDLDGEDVQNRYSEIRAGKSAGIGGHTYYGYRPDLRGEVTETLRRFGLDPDTNAIRMVQGVYEETLHPEGAVALAHIDCDWYESVRCCLDRLWPLLSIGGSLVIDDYYSWSGCRQATDEFTNAHAGELQVKKFARPHIVKLR